MGAEWSQALNSGNDASIEEGGTATIKGTFGCCAVRTRETPSKLRSRLPDWSGVSIRVAFCCFRIVVLFYVCVCLCGCQCTCWQGKSFAGGLVARLDDVCVFFSTCLPRLFFYLRVYVSASVSVSVPVCLRDILRSNNSGLDSSPVPEGFIYIGAIGGAADITSTAASNLTTSCYKSSCYKHCCSSSSYSS